MMDSVPSFYVKDTFIINLAFIHTFFLKKKISLIIFYVYEIK